MKWENNEMGKQKISWEKKYRHNGMKQFAEIFFFKKEIGANFISG